MPRFTCLISLLVSLLFCATPTSNQENAESAVPKKLDQIIAAILQVTRTLQRLEEKIVYINSNKLKKLTSAVQELLPCPLPWENFDGVCLRLFWRRLSWKNAEELCNSKGGYLVWFRNANEHHSVNQFLQLRNCQNFYHIGLHRPGHNHLWLNWTSHADSYYRGDPFVNPGEKWFAAKADTNGFYGYSGSILTYALCRRAPRDENKMNLTKHWRIFVFRIVCLHLQFSQLLRVSFNQIVSFVLYYRSIFDHSQ